jgi:hypothetical protein
MAAQTTPTAPAARLDAKERETVVPTAIGELGAVIRMPADTAATHPASSSSIAPTRGPLRLERLG